MATPTRPTPAVPRRSPVARRRRTAEIIEAAARVFAERGYHGASTQDIADVVGIRQASLYYYFASKEIALEQVCLRGVEGFVERAEAVVQDKGSAAEKVRRLIHSHLQPTADRGSYVKVFLRERHRLPDASRRRVGRMSRRYERLVQEILELGVKRGEFRRDLDCRLATLALLGMCNAVSSWYGIEPRAGIERVADEFGRLLVDGLVSTRKALARAGAKAAPAS